MKKISIAISGIGNRALPKDIKKSFWTGWVQQLKKSKKYNLVAAHDVSTKKLKKLLNNKILKSNL